MLYDRVFMRYSATSKKTGIQILRENVRMDSRGQLKVSVTRNGKKSTRGRSVQAWIGTGIWGRAEGKLGMRDQTQTKFI